MARLIDYMILKDLTNFFDIIATPDLIDSLPVDVIETPEGYQIYAEIPGVKKDDIKVEIEKGRIVRISVEKKEPEVKDGKHLIKGRVYGKLVKSIKLPTTIDSGKIKGSYENGVLSFFVFKDKKDRIEVEIE